MKNDFSFKLLCIYISILFFLFFLSLYFGAVGIPLSEFKNLFSDKSSIYLKILSLRLNNFLLAVNIGSILALSGYVLQKILRNPLADPYILGISSGGTCFASLFIIFSSSSYFPAVLLNGSYSLLSLCAFFGCSFSFLLLILFKRKIKSFDAEYVFPVLGIILNSFFSSVLMMTFALASPEKLAELHNWLIGNLPYLSFEKIYLLYLCSLFPVIIIIKYAKNINILQFGDEFSKSLGIRPETIRNILVFCVCFLIAIIVSNAGAIGFIGLIVPHIVQKIHKYSARFEAILCMMVGAIVLLVADLFSRILFSPAQIPVGVFTAIIGAPCLALILLRRRNNDN